MNKITLFKKMGLNWTKK